MARADAEFTGALRARRVLNEHSITTLPVDPIAIAEKVGITVIAKPATAGGVSGMLIRQGNNFAIGYATHIQSKGFQNFSIAHELGHYFLDGHADAVFRDGNVHHSRAGSFASDDRYELEADHFAAELLMPEDLFKAEVGRAGSGFEAIERLSDLCVTSLTATAIRYGKYTDDVAAVVVSEGKHVRFCVMSKEFMALAGNNRISKGEKLPPGCPTDIFNRDSERIARAEREAGESPLQDWIGGNRSVDLIEEVVGLGGYGRTLTVLTAKDVVDVEALEEDEQIETSWAPRFRR
jgi:Zn-dependent peptidase ImmA (M78 family)